VHGAQLHEAVPPRVHPGAPEEAAADQIAAAIDLVIEVRERAETPHEPGRAERPAGAGIAFAIADLWHEADVGAEITADVLVLQRRVVAPRDVSERKDAGVRRQGSHG